MATSAAVTARPLRRLFAGDNEMTQRLHTADWSSSRVGPPETWPRCLQAAVELCAASPIPLHICWPGHHGVVGNAAFAKHFSLTERYLPPEITAPRLWAANWSAILPLLQRALAGEAVHADALGLVMTRSRQEEEVFLSIGLSPVYNERGEVAGVLGVTGDVTERVVDARRADVLRRVALAARGATPLDLVRNTLDVMATAHADLSAVAVYLCDERGAFTEPTHAFGTTARGATAADVALPIGPVQTACRARATSEPFAWADAALRGADAPAAGMDRGVAVPIFTPDTGTVAGVAVVGLAPRRPWDNGYRHFVGAIAEHLGAGLAESRAHAAERQRSEADRQEVLRRVIAAQEKERAQLARDLHDHLGQNLAACRLLLPLLSHVQPQTRQDAVTQLHSLTTDLAQDLHRLAVALRPTALDDLGLEPTVESYVSDWSDMTGITASCHFSGLGDRLPLEIETTFYRILQEALSNVAKHARARGVSVIIERKETTLAMVVEDDGAGFVLDGVLAGGASFGITAMRERAALIGGEFNLESSPGGGTSVYLRVRVPRP